MPSDSTHVLAMVNLVLCLGIIWACIGRLSNAPCQQCKLTRLRWVLLLTAAQAHGLQPLLFQTWPDVAGALFAGAVWLHVALRWR